MSLVTLATDDFNRANALNLGANWTLATSLQQAIQIVSNQIQPISTAAASREDYTAIVWPDDQWCQATLIASASTTTNGLRVRSTPTGGTLLNSYELIFPGATGGAITVTLRKLVNSVATTLGTVGTTLNVNDVFRVEAQGTTLRAYKNNVLIIGPITDSSLTSGDPGLTMAISAGVASQSIMDAFSGGNFDAAATPTFSPVAGSYGSTQNVTISSTTPGASIFYTTDGSSPTTASTLYTIPVVVASSLTLKAIATAVEFANSAIGSAVYTISSGGGSTKSGSVQMNQLNQLQQLSKF